MLFLCITHTFRKTANTWAPTHLFSVFYQLNYSGYSLFNKQPLEKVVISIFYILFKANNCSWFIAFNIKCFSLLGLTTMNLCSRTNLLIFYSYLILETYYPILDGLGYHGLWWKADALFVLWLVDDLLAPFFVNCCHTRGNNRLQQCLRKFFAFSHWIEKNSSSV